MLEILTVFMAMSKDLSNSSIASVGLIGCGSETGVMLTTVLVAHNRTGSVNSAHCFDAQRLVRSKALNGTVSYAECAEFDTLRALALYNRTSRRTAWLMLAVAAGRLTHGLLPVLSTMLGRRGLMFGTCVQMAGLRTSCRAHENM